METGEVPQKLGIPFNLRIKHSSVKCDLTKVWLRNRRFQVE